MKKQLIVMAFGILMLFSLFSIVSAALPFTTVQEFTEGYSITVHPIKQYFKIGEDVKFHVHVFNKSTGKTINSSIECFFHMYNNTNHKVNLNTTTVNDLFDYEFLVLGGNFTKDVTSYHAFCENGVGGDYEYAIKVTPTGEELTTAKAFLYGFVLLLIGMFLFFSINGIRKSESGAWLVAYICLTYILVYALMGILYLMTGNFLWEMPIIESILYIVWFIMGIGFLPFVIILSLYILGKETRATLEQDYMKQGYTRDEARELSKKNKR